MPDAHDCPAVRQQYARHLQILREVTQQMLGGDLDGALEQVARRAVEIFSAVHADILLAEGQHLVMFTSSGLEHLLEGHLVVPLQYGLVGKAATLRQAIICPDVRQESRYIPLLPEVTAVAAIPIIAADHLYGVLNVESQQPDAFSGVAPDLLQSLADETALVLHNAQVRRQERKRLAELTQLRELGLSLTQAHNPATAYDLGVEYAVRLVDALAAYLYLYDAQSDGGLRGSIRHANATGLKLVAGPGIPGLALYAAPLLLPGCPAHLAARTGQPVVVSELVQATDPVGTLGSGRGIKSLAAVPLCHNQHVSGVLLLNFAYVRHLQAEEVDLLLLLGEQLSRHLDNIHLHAAELQRLSELDALQRVSGALRQATIRAEIQDVLLQEVMALFKADAVCIAYPGDGPYLRIVQARGWLQRFSHLPFGLQDSIAGYVFTSGQAYTTDDLSSDPRSSPLARSLFGFEQRAAMFAPLRAVRQITGVLMVGTTAPERFSPADIKMLGTLAEVAGAALHRAQLYESLELSNVELAQAYDSTLLGWARTLEYRDKETEGHCERVVELAQELALAMGIKGSDLVNLRRGALLHDIGKMAIPDSVLLKSGPLLPDEWDLMHLHPQYAYEMLAPVDFLRPALDIPYHHHEKWDGSGYPMGLKGEAIPLAARIFAVVDVWDALVNDRPYRKAWGHSEALRYIEVQAGRHFDPAVVQAFLGLRR